MIDNSVLCKKKKKNPLQYTVFTVYIIFKNKLSEGEQFIVIMWSVRRHATKLKNFHSVTKRRVRYNIPVKQTNAT